MRTATPACLAVMAVEKRKMADLKKLTVKAWLLAACLCMLWPGKAMAADGASANAMAGILEVQSGFLDGKGDFQKMKSGSGFLIANKKGDTYLVTSCSNVSNTPRGIEKYCKKHSIDTEGMQASNYIQIVVKGDVTAQAEVVAKSVEKDYCILSAANVVSQKEALKLGDSEGIKENDLVYAYGFPQKAGTGAEVMEYSEMDVQETQGAVIKKEAYLDAGVYLAHSALLEKGYVGGPLLDADGYVVGLNCRQPKEVGAGIAYALPIHEVCAVLGNFSIYYGSRAIDGAYAQLEALYNECIDIQAAGGYKAASMEALERELAAVEEAMRQEEPHAEDLQEAARSLAKVKEGLTPKAGAMAVAIWVLAVGDALLFLWTLILVFLNAKEKKAMQAPQPSAGGGLRVVRKKTGQAICVNKSRFVFGKSQELADYCVTDNQTVSRKHAVLFADHGRWYVDDLNSLNGTYVNGSKIVPGQAVGIQGGDEVALSDEAFLVQGYEL